MKLVLETATAAKELKLSATQARYLKKYARRGTVLWRELGALLTVTRRAEHTQDIIALFGKTPDFVNKQKSGTRSYKWYMDPVTAVRFTRLLKQACRPDLRAVYRPGGRFTPGSLSVYRAAP